MTKKIIGISANVITEDKKPFLGCKRIMLVQEYVDAVINAGGLPIVIPMTNDIDTMKSQIELVDGLILSGGYDIHSLLYGEEPTVKLHDVSVYRDNCEMELLKNADKKKIPILGICRGLQLLNVFYGGNLYQDLSLKEGSYIKHFEEGNPTLGFHTIDLMKDSILFTLLGEKETVNSYHHLAVKHVADGFKVAAYSKDGVIEAIERKTPFAMGVQWHPEMMQEENDKMKKIFKFFIEQC
ncbi:MAG: gamma-glutamyl-gamma-aminobutyrate hydrolase family protein [Clostridium sp.]